MSGIGSGGGTDDRAADTWTNETLSLSRRKELLERELKRLGFRKAGAGGGGAPHSALQQQQSQAEGSHPQAGGDAPSHGA